MNTVFDTLLATFQSWHFEQQKRRNLARAQRFLASLPNDIRKDIGWPDGRLTAASLPLKGSRWDTEAFLAQTERRSRQSA